MNAISLPFHTHVQAWLYNVLPWVSMATGSTVGGFAVNWVISHSELLSSLSAGVHGLQWAMRACLWMRTGLSPLKNFLWLHKSDREVPWDPHPKLISYHETSSGMHVHECVVLFRCSYREITGLYLWSVVTASNKYPVLNPEDATLVWHWEWGWGNWVLEWMLYFVLGMRLVQFVRMRLAYESSDLLTDTQLAGVYVGPVWGPVCIPHAHPITMFWSIKFCVLVAA